MFTVNDSNFISDGYVRLQWDNTGVSVNFYAWRLYRRWADDPTWVLIYETTNNVAAYTFDDYFAHANAQNDWALTQVTQVGSVQTEGVYTVISDTPYSEDYWLLHSTDPAYNIKLQHVTEDSYSDEYEEATLKLIGRGRKKDQGTEFGITGSLTADMRDTVSETAKEQRQKVETLKETQTEMYLRTPFGQVWKVALGQLTFNRTPGVGIREFGALTIPYEEVA